MVAGILFHPLFLPSFRALQQHFNPFKAFCQHFRALKLLFFLTFQFCGAIVKLGKEDKVNERVKKLRNNLGLTLEKFGENLGVGKNAISRIETGKSKLTNQMFTAICNVNWDGKYVNEEWLRTGEGDMFKKPSNKALYQLKHDYGLTNKEYDFIARFLSLKPEMRIIVADFITETAERLAAPQRLNADNDTNFAINSDINTKEFDSKNLAERVVAAEIEYEKSLGIVPKKSFAERVAATKAGYEKKSVVSNNTIDATESNTKIYKISDKQQKPDKT